MTELPDLLGVDAVLQRYGLRDRAAARNLMRKAGGFVAAGRLVVRVDDLDAFERTQAAAARRAAAPPPRGARRTRGPHRSQRARARAAKLEPGWWREAQDEV